MSECLWKPAVFPWLEFHLQLGLFMARFDHLSAALTLHIALRFSPVCPLLIRLVRHARAAHFASFLPSCLSSKRNCNALHSPFLFQLHCHSAHLCSLIEVRKSKFHLVFEFIFGLAWNLTAGMENGGCTSNLNDNIYHAPHLSSLPLEALSLLWHRQAH